MPAKYQATLSFIAALLLSNGAQALMPDPIIYNNHFIDLENLTPSTFDPDSLKLKTLQDVLSSIRPGEVIVMGETHDDAVEHANQVRFMESLISQNLRKQGPIVSTGLEFLEYPFQNVVDSYVAGEISDQDFIKNTHWTDPHFDMYQKQILDPVKNGGKTYALNLPADVAHAISENGVSKLPLELSKFLPPDFHLGSPEYKKRLIETLNFVHPESTLGAYDRFFEAMCAWDDTMAWNVAKAHEQNPNQILIVIVGSFHANYGGGIQARMRARGIKDILTIHQYNVTGQSLIDLKSALTPDPNYGVITDLVWVTGEPSK